MRREDVGSASEESAKECDLLDVRRGWFRDRRPSRRVTFGIGGRQLLSERPETLFRLASSRFDPGESSLFS